MLKRNLLLSVALPALCATAFLLSSENLRITQKPATSDSLRRWWTEEERFYSGTYGQVEITAAGDIMLGSWIVDKVHREGADAPFDGTRLWTSSADIAVANLEAPFADSGRLYVEKQYTFKVPTFMVEGIVNAGIDVLTLANNHIMDYGCDGLMQTIRTLEGAGLRFCGAGRNFEEACAPVIMEVNGLRLAFLGLTTTYPEEFWATPTRCGTCRPSEEQEEAIIRAAKQESDLVIINIHWGTEKKNTPNPDQIARARRYIDYGADVVLGHHPHVLQGFELYRGRLIAFSLGNYVFGSLSENAHTAALLRLTLDRTGLVKGLIVPIHVYNAVVNFQPQVLRGEAGRRVIAELQQLSRPLNGGRLIISDDGVIMPTVEAAVP